MLGGCFLEGSLRFLMYTILIFTFGCTAYIWHLVFIFYGLFGRDDLEEREIGERERE